MVAREAKRILPMIADRSLQIPLFGCQCSQGLHFHEQMTQHDTLSDRFRADHVLATSIPQLQPNFPIQSHTSVYRCFELILYWLLVAAAQSRSQVWVLYERFRRTFVLVESFLDPKTLQTVCRWLALSPRTGLLAPAVSTTAQIQCCQPPLKPFLLFFCLFCLRLSEWKEDAIHCNASLRPRNFRG